MARIFLTGGSGFLGRYLIKNLVDKGNQVLALVRSDFSAEKVIQLGADPVRADITSEDAMRSGMQGCQYVVHAAAKVGHAGSAESFDSVNVIGTKRVISAGLQAGVQRLIYVSDSAVLLGGKPLTNIDETQPYPAGVPGYYAKSKQLAEKLVLAANNYDMETVIVRPQLLWGYADNYLLPFLIRNIRQGQFFWISGGSALSSTCHVENAAEGILLAAAKGKPGAVYFLTDGDDISIKEFINSLLETVRLQPVAANLPYWLARRLAVLTVIPRFAWRTQKFEFINGMTVQVFGQQHTLNDSLARREIGYRGRISREQGLLAMVMSGIAPRHEFQE